LQRDQVLQNFADAALSACRKHSTRTEASAALERIAAALNTPGPRRARPGERLPVCRHLDAALAIDTGSESLRALIEAFRAIEPFLEWRQRASFDETASANFVDGHANAMIVGPGGLEGRADVQIGVSLLAPHVRYPDHNHAPEEVYLVLSPGRFQHGGSGWFEPGIGGTLYNEPNILHAMASDEAPLLALWFLWTGKPSHAT
jgi:hypothetical protein